MKIAKISIAIIAAGLLSLSVMAQKNNNFVIKGKLGNLQAPAKLYILYTANNVGVHDSANIINGEFTLTQNTPYPVRAVLAVSRNGISTRRFSVKDITHVYIEPNATIILTSDESIVNAKFAGSKSQADYEIYEKAVAQYDKEIQDLQPATQPAKDENEGIQNFMDRYHIIDAKKKGAMKNFVLEHPNMYISLDVLDEYAGQYIDYRDVEPIFNKLNEQTKESMKGKSFQQKIQDCRKTAIGTMAPEFSQADTSGNSLSLSSFRGKYVLLDFWASWCGPCRAENPELTRIFMKYKDKNFTILSVSLDYNRQKWIDAIKKDGLTWYHVSDLKYWKNEVATLYYITLVPQNILIDPTGRIIARNLKGLALETKLSGIIK